MASATKQRVPAGVAMLFLVSDPAVPSGRKPTVCQQLPDFPYVVPA